MRFAVVALSLSMSFASTACASHASSRRPIATFEDAERDATGPGTYVLPLSDQFREGDFDLVRFAVSADGADLLFEVTLAQTIRRPAMLRRESDVDAQLWNGIYLQNVDIYVDSDPSPESGFAACIPGRRVTFADDRKWEGAVVITPQPGPARAVTEGALGAQTAAKIHFAEGLEVRGRTVTARVPAAFFGTSDARTWGYSVHVSGARWERTFALMDRVRGEFEQNAFTLPVVPIAERFAFGGAPEGMAHPRVLDVLLPPGVDQAAVLGSFKRDGGTLARVPFVHAAPPTSDP